MVELKKEPRCYSRRTTRLGPSKLSPFTDPDRHVSKLRKKQTAKGMKKGKTVSQPMSSEELKLDEMFDPMTCEGVNVTKFQAWWSMAKETKVTTSLVVENIPRVDAKWFNALWNPEGWLTDEVL